MYPFQKRRSRMSRIAAAGVCAFTLGFTNSASAQVDGIGGLNNPIQDRLSPGNTLDSGNSLRRGVGEAVRSGLEGRSVGQSIQRGFGEAAQSAVETPQQTFQRDQFRANQQFYGDGTPYSNQPYGQPNAYGQTGTYGQIGTYNNRTLYQDGQTGRQFYWDNQGRQVFVQPQTYGSSRVYSTPQRTYQQPYQRQGTIQGQGYVQGQPYNQGQSWQGQQGQTFQGQGQTASQNRGRLGVSIENSDQGVRVTNVQPQSAAEEAGLQTGDIIKSVNGQQVQSTSSLANRISSMNDQSLDMVVMRNGQQQQLSANLMAQSERGDDTYRAAKPASDADQQTLMQLRKENEQLRQEIQQLREQMNPSSSQEQKDSATSEKDEKESSDNEGDNEGDTASGSGSANAGGRASVDTSAADREVGVDASKDGANANATADDK